MKIDLHTHILPKTIPDFHQKFGYGTWIRLHHVDHGKCEMRYNDGRHFRDVTANTFDAETRIGEMNQTGVDVQVLSTVPVMFSYWAKPQDCLDVSQFLNDDVAATVATHPNRFVGLGTIPMHHAQLAVEELKRIKRDLKLAGIQIGSHVNDLGLGDGSFDPIYKTCEDLNLPIFVHPWDMPSGGHWDKYWLKWLVGMPAETTAAISSLLMAGVLHRFPRLRFCFAHGGGSFPLTVGRINHGYNVRPDLCANDCSEQPSSFLGQFYVDSLVHSESALMYTLSALGEDKVCVGSDYPFPLGESRPGDLIESCAMLSSEVKEKLLWKNVINFLGDENCRFMHSDSQQ